MDRGNSTSRRAAVRRVLTPSRLLLGSFLTLIAFGTLGLKLLPGLYTGEGLGWIDALFTATSAVCVTGLIVVDTATYFTLWGQAFLLLLIQLGGLGILTFTTLLILAVGGRLSLHHEAVTATHTDVSPDIDFRHLVRTIVVFTFVFEAIGAIVLFLAFAPRFPTATATWHAVFQAISAFCNAGFSTFSDSLLGFQGAPVVQGVVMVLIVLGGLGFLVLEEVNLFRRRRMEGRRVTLSLHSKLALATTAVLLLGGWLMFSALEWTNTLGDMAVWQKLMNGLFMSVTARTAGFNTVDYAATADSSNFITILLMSVGGSPGSTAGGIKTTTFALIGLLALSRLRGRQVTSVGNRTIPEETIQRAVGLFVVAFAIVTSGILLYAVLQIGAVGHGEAGGSFIQYMFEGVSAFNTVGLSMGVTGDLSGASRLVTVFLMYVGRVGPLSFAAAIALRRPSATGEFRYAYEDVIIG
ncbi:MAG: potassium transporter TrkG [Longimicrobiales bacterium]